MSLYEDPLEVYDGVGREEVTTNTVQSPRSGDVSSVIIFSNSDRKQAMLSGNRKRGISSRAD